MKVLVDGGGHLECEKGLTPVAVIGNLRVCVTFLGPK